MERCRFGQAKSTKRGVVEAVNRGGADVSSLLQREKKGEKTSTAQEREMKCDVIQFGRS